MRFLFDYFPIICFFIAFKIWGIYVATIVTMAASVLQMGVYWLKHKKFEKLHVITLISVVVLGGLTLIFHKAIYIKWKPSIIYWAFALVLWFTCFQQKTLMQRMLGEKIQLPANIWRNLTIAWGIFFLLMGFINLYVVYHFSTNAWVNFKLFGTLGLTIVFVVAQAFYMSRYMKEPADKDVLTDKSDHE